MAPFSTRREGIDDEMMMKPGNFLCSNSLFF